MKFYGQFRYKVDQMLYERYFKENPLKDIGICLEAGASDGVTLSSTKVFEDEFNWKCINIEPFKKMYDRLVVNRPKSININCGLSDKCGTVLFKYISDRSLMGKITEKRKDSSGPFKYVEIEVKTYKDILEEQNIDHIDLMVLDVEGHEINVIRGMNECKCLPKIFCIECNVIKGGINTLVDILKPLGYTLDYTKRINAIFIRE